MMILGCFTYCEDRCEIKISPWKGHDLVPENGSVNAYRPTSWDDENPNKILRPQIHDIEQL